MHLKSVETPNIKNKWPRTILPNLYTKTFDLSCCWLAIIEVIMINNAFGDNSNKYQTLIQWSDNYLRINYSSTTRQKSSLIALGTYD